VASDAWAYNVDLQEAELLENNRYVLKRGAAPPKERHAWLEKQEDDDEEEVPRASQSLLNKLIRQSLVESNHKVEVLQRDPSSPLYSVKTFEELRLKSELLHGIYSMGFNRPSKIQATALPMMLADPPQNLIAQSQSGTGKTAAFVLAMLSRANPDEKFAQCLCLSPTYELALQTGQVIEQMGKYSPVTVTYAVRGNRIERGTQIEDQIVIGTPGTVLDWCFKLKLIDVKKIRVFVLDEADVMIDTQGYSDQSVRIQRSEVEVTFAVCWERLKCKLKLLKNISNYNSMPIYRDNIFMKILLIKNTVYHLAVTIHIHMTRRIAKWLSSEMIHDGHQVALLSGELLVEQRAAVIQRFRDGKEKVLITTNVCARGIDVEQVSIVVNFDLPMNRERNPDFETYLHRIGRTGRFGKPGLAINLVDSMYSRNVLHRIEQHFRKKIKELDTEDIDEIEKIGY
uniref:RNA helicase n=1 Tax=Latimeria chalumnae TaxID=7897 RepID=H3BDW2_LATCH